MQLLHLQYFCSVAKFGSISRAAEELWISQPALSKAIGGLEEELGVLLFDRVGRNISLSPAGDLYYRQISKILARINDITTEVQRIHLRTNREIRVLLSAANFIAGWLYQGFHRQYPDTTLLISSFHMAELKQIAQSDFHIFASPSVYDNMECTTLMKENLVLAMSPRHPLASRSSISLADTKDYLYQCLPPNENLRANLFHFCRLAGFTPTIGFSTEDSFTFFDVLASHDYIAMVPEITVTPILRKKLALRPISDPACTRTLSLGWGAKHKLSPHDHNFIDFCKEMFTPEGLQQEFGEGSGWEM